MDKKDGQENEEIQFKEHCLPRGCISDLESYCKVNFFNMSLDQVIGKLINRFQGRDSHCNLGKICLGENAKAEKNQNFTTQIWSFSNVTVDCRLW